MPTYDYRCNSCSHRWELFQSMTAKHEKTCPSCGKKTAERLIGTDAAVMFKGSGFYQTDYRSDSYKKAADADKPATTSESKPAETKTTATPADKKPEATNPVPAKAKSARAKSN